MSIGSEIGDALGNAATGGIPSAVTSVSNLINGILDRAVPNPVQKMQIQAQIAQAERDQDLKQLGLIYDNLNAQLEVNKAEASSSSVFTSGWRPAIGWTCALSLFYQYFLSPIVVWGSNLVGHPLPMPPSLDSMLWELMFGMLGLGGLRTYEKVKGVSR